MARASATAIEGRRAIERDFVPKEVSWLSFNARVLQEAADTSVPLINRIRFLGIYSSNMDEFFEVRVATLKRLAALGKKGRRLIGMDPGAVLAEIQKIVLGLHKEYEGIHRDIVSGLADRNIHFVDERSIDGEQTAFVEDLFRQRIWPRIFPVILHPGVRMPELKDRGVFLMVRLESSASRASSRYAFIEIPADDAGRFIVLPKGRNAQCVMMLDDAIRLELPRIFASTGFDRFEAFDFKVTRDAELDWSEDISQSFLEKINKSVNLRKRGRPVRLGYDERMPGEMLAFLLKKLKFRAEDTVIPGGRYHNIKDFMRFPDLIGDKSPLYPPPIEHPALSRASCVLEAIRERDAMLQFPFHSFHHVIDLLREASLDPRVRTIKITLYRVARNSSVVGALVNAVRNGKQVTVLLELQARFDEMNNIDAANRLREEGATVVFSMPGLKVHSKLILVERRDKDGGKIRYCAISTGNFNEDTARLYTDSCLLTARRKVTEDIAGLFDLFENIYRRMEFGCLVVAPYSMRAMLESGIARETENAKRGKPAYIDLKVNNLSDKPIVDLLYEASSAGVKVRLLVRGMFSLAPGCPGLSENIEARCVIDKYLEHSRTFFFCNDGDERCYISSADILPRNLDRRIEVACPIHDEAIRAELRDIFEIYWKDNVKSRILDQDQENRYHSGGKRKVRAQDEVHRYLEAKAKGV